MSNLQKAKELLNEKNASLIVIKGNVQKEYYNHGIKDLIDILSQDKNALKDATVADTTVGKVAGAIMIKAGVKEIYAIKISKMIIPLLDKSKIEYEYLTIQEFIQNKDKTGMCPMETKFKDEMDINKIYDEYIK